MDGFGETRRNVSLVQACLKAETDYEEDEELYKDAS
jgi:hypothetical protein